jgi:hypothetical protein
MILFAAMVGNLVCFAIHSIELSEPSRAEAAIIVSRGNAGEWRQ